MSKKLINLSVRLSNTLFIFLTIVLAGKVQGSDKQKIELTQVSNKQIKYTQIKGFNVVYDMHIDKNGELYIPDFESGIIFRFSKNMGRLPDIGGYLEKSQEVKFKNIHAVFKVNDSFYIVEMRRNRILELKDGQLANEFGSDNLVEPVNIEQLPDKKLYVSNWHGNSIDRYDLAGNYIDSLDLTKPKAKWNSQNKRERGLSAPHSIKLIEETGQYLIADQYSKRVIKIDENKEIKILTWVAEKKNTEWVSSVSNDKSSHAIFQSPTYVELIGGVLLVSDTVANRILFFDLKTGNLIGCIGDKTNLLNLHNGSDLILSKIIHIPIELNNPYGVRYSQRTSNLYIADRKNRRVIILSAGSLISNQIIKKEPVITQ